MQNEQSGSKKSPGYSFVTVAPKSSKNPALQRLKSIQDQERNLWRGLDIESIGRVHPIQPFTIFDTIMLRSHSERCKVYLQQFPNPFPDDFLTFTPVTDQQLVKDHPVVSAYGKTGFWQTKELLYRIVKGDGKIIRSTLEQQGFRYTESHDWNILWMCSSPKPYIYDGLNEHQRVNHFPFSNEITRKDKMSQNLLNMQELHGKQDFDFFPETFILPDEFGDLYSQFNLNKNQTWIVKPSCSSQGRGIYLVDSINEVPVDEGCVISRYINNPLLINNLKFDLRIYVLVTCFDPLKIYVYSEGLARFATEAYTTGSKANRYMHLTNYSVNKKSSNFVQNNDPSKDDIGNKWSLSALFKHLQSVGVDTNLLWSRICDVIIKSLISIEHMVVDGVKRHGLQRSNCFDLYGFDILIDSNLKPWLLEVNLSPSLAADSPLDLFIKGNLIADVFNLIGLKIFDRKKESLNKVKTRLRARYAQQTIAKRGNQPKVQINSKKIQSLANSLKFQEVIRQTSQEFLRKGNFQRIFPCLGSDAYDKYFQTPRLTNLTLYYGLFTLMNKERNIVQRPLTEGATTSKRFIKYSQEKVQQEESVRRCCYCRDVITDTSPYLCQKCRHQHYVTNEKLVITGDDVLIEYISRLRFALKSVSMDALRQDLKSKIEAFVNHPVWSNQDRKNNPHLWEKLDTRLIEMRERKRRMVKGAKQDTKSTIVRGLSATQLEEMLQKTTKNVAKELVNCLLWNGEGVLSEIIKQLAQNSFDGKVAIEDKETNVQDSIVSTKRSSVQKGSQSSKSQSKVFQPYNWKSIRRPITSNNVRRFI